MATTHDDKMRDLAASAGDLDMRSWAGEREWVLQRRGDNCRVTGVGTIYEGTDFERAVAIAHEFMLTGKQPE